MAPITGGDGGTCSVNVRSDLPRWTHHRQGNRETPVFRARRVIHTTHPFSIGRDGIWLKERAHVEIFGPQRRPAPMNSGCLEVPLVRRTSVHSLSIFDVDDQLDVPGAPRDNRSFRRSQLPPVVNENQCSWFASRGAQI